MPTNNFEQVTAVLGRARHLLSGFPNVVGVGVGTKRIAGVATEEWCLSVSVRTKLLPAQLLDGERIPAEVEGVPTDVTETGDIVSLVLDKADGTECYELETYRPLRGGIKIGTASSTTGGIENNVLGFGTLGCVVFTNQLPPRRAVLTNWHVVSAILPHGPIGQPHADPGSTCCGSSELIGNVIAIPKDISLAPSLPIFAVDAALCALTEGMQWEAGIATAARGSGSPAAPIAGIRDLKLLSPPPNMPVKKRGARTGLTTGKVAAHLRAFPITAGGRSFEGIDVRSVTFPHYISLPVLEIRADEEPTFAVTAVTNAKPCEVTAPGHSFQPGNVIRVFGLAGMDELKDRYVKVGTLSPAAGRFTLFDLKNDPLDSTAFGIYAGGGMAGLLVPFSLEGDSGSMICDLNDRIVGLLWGGPGVTDRLPAGSFAWASYIQDVLTEMDISVPTTAGFPGPQPVPANNNAFKAIKSASDSNVMAKVQNDLLDTEHGIVLARAVLSHRSEVRALVGSNRRVAARWRHVSDPQLVSGFTAAVANPDLPITGVPPHQAKRALNLFAAVLERYGSRRLREDVRLCRELLVAMMDFTYREILRSLGTRTHAEVLDDNANLSQEVKHVVMAMQAMAAACPARTSLPA